MLTIQSSREVTFWKGRNEVYMHGVMFVLTISMESFATVSKCSVETRVRQRINALLTTQANRSTTHKLAGLRTVQASGEQAILNYSGKVTCLIPRPTFIHGPGDSFLQKLQSMITAKNSFGSIMDGI